MDKRILIFSDSLALPRLDPETTKYEETWSCLLSKYFINVDEIMSDHHHLNPIGHKYVFDMVVKKIKTCLKN